MIPILELRRQSDVIAKLLLLETAPLDIFWLGLRKLHVLNLKNGLKNVGLPSLIIAQQCLDQNLELWIFDKHFKIMSGFTELKLLQIKKSFRPSSNLRKGLSF
jgi:hypothetical protein